MNPAETPLNTTEFWVQVHKIPSTFFTKKVAATIRSFLGAVIQSDNKSLEGQWKNFLHIRVRLDITKPLRRKMKMKEGGDFFWVEFQYETLHNFCFLCGIIGHADKFCHKLFEGADETIERPYVAWMRASGR